MAPTGSPIEVVPGLPLDAAVIERELARIWRESYQDSHEEARNLKITLSNLIIIAADARRGEAAAIISYYAARRPSRVIAITIADDASSPAYALVSASCNLTDGMRDRLCWEQVTIEAGPDDITKLAGLVRSLMTGGEIPIVLIDLYGLKREIDLRPQFYGLSDFVFVDCRHDTSLLLPPPGQFKNRQVYSLQWVTIDPLREAIRAFFDDPQRLALLDHLDGIVLNYGAPHEHITAEMQLLAGWLVSSLGLEVDTTGVHRISATGPSGLRVAVEWHGHKDQPPESISVSMHFQGVREALQFSMEGFRVMVLHGGQETVFAPKKSFDARAFVVEQSGKDRLRSSYGASYRAAISLHNLQRGITGSRAMIVVPDPPKLAAVAARLFYSLALRRLAIAHRFFVALAGGTTPKAVYKAMVESPYARAVDWENVFFFFGDERPVGPDHRDANYKLANDHLFQPLGIKPDNVFRIEGELRPYRDICRHYTDVISHHLPRGRNNRPRFDLIFLGVGEDGHTASLFPEFNSLRLNPDRIVIPVFVAKLDQHRITFTLSLINSAAHIFFIASGENKAEALQKIFFPEHRKTLPAARVNPENGSILWLVDRTAVSRLTGMTLPIEVSQW